MRLHLKRWLYLTHRWLGVVLCAFFAMWFVSGVVMMYVGYPKLTQAERLQHLPPLGDGTGLLAPRQALDAAGLHGPLSALRLAVARGGAPVYLVVPDEPASAGAGRRRSPPGSGTVVIDAVTGERLQGVDGALALASAAAYAGSAGIAGMQYFGTIQEDTFTHSRGLDAHRPLHRVQLLDPDSTRLYISSLTGEVVRDATKTERIWNYAGAWIHWLYPFRGNRFDPYWADIVNWLSIIGIAVTLIGTVVGIMRWRFQRPYRSGSRSPYTERMMRWHHISGLLFALITFTWIFSGLMSMNPWRGFDVGAAPLQMKALQGAALDLAADHVAPAVLLAEAGGNVRELRWAPGLGALTVQAAGPVGRPQMLDARSASPVFVDEVALRDAAVQLLDAPVERIDRLTEYDFHYYDREAHTMTGGTEKPLPILRVVLEDPQASWVHIDLHTGAVLGRSDAGRRASRWLFALLHSWDWLPLLNQRPLWDLLLIVLSAGGTLLSVTGIVIGWRRLGLKLRSVQHSRAPKVTKELMGTSQFDRRASLALVHRCDAGCASAPDGGAAPSSETRK